jgi:hypothetical protein
MMKGAKVLAQAQKWQNDSGGYHPLISRTEEFIAIMADSPFKNLQRFRIQPCISPPGRGAWFPE